MLLPANMAAAGPAIVVGDLEVVYLNHGNGDTAVYRGACGDVGIVDVNVGADGAVLDLLDRWGARDKVRWIAASHMHADHIGGIRAVAEATGATIVHRGAPAYNSQTYRDLMASAAGREHIVASGDSFDLCDGTFFEVLWSGSSNDTASFPTSDENARSMCLKVEHFEFTKGTCGDLLSAGETALASTLGRLDVWKVSHHGSSTSSPASLIDTIRPEAAVLTVGRNSYGHPSSTVVSRYTTAGTTLFQTADATGAAVDGDITITAGFDGDFFITSSQGRTYTSSGVQPPQPVPVGPACEGTPRNRFPDVTSGSHAFAIDCIGWWGVTQGNRDGTYNPTGTVTRDQMASFVARTIELSGGTLPNSPANHFTDDNGNAHELRINQLAELGVVGGVGGGRYAPARNVTRAQMATFLANAWEARTGSPLPAGRDFFTDVDGDTHQARINAVAQAGLTGGAAPGIYNPGGDVTRAQMGTFLARFMAKLVADGHTTHPPANPVPMPPPPAPAPPPPAPEPPADPAPGCVNINTASTDDLQRIIHIGPDRAAEIVRLRPFSRVEDLERVSGIGPARIRDIINQGVACVS
ncbi:S-layer homology domain-containing protein [Egicoccus sp. AB-alg2]